MTDSRPDESQLISEAVAYAAGLDASAVRRELSAPQGPHRWPRHRLNEVDLEWRRWRLRRWLAADDDPPGSIKLFERLAVAAGMPPAATAPLATEVGGALTTLSYDEMFPQGPLIAKAMQARVVRQVAARETDEQYAAMMLASTRRREDYLRKLPDDTWWMIGDLISEATRRACVAEIATLPASAGAAYDGGLSPGWDKEHDALVSRSCNAYLGAGPTLVAIHEDPALVAQISARMGRRMYPTRCTYLEYRPGDFLGVHTDQPTCEVSLLFTVDGEPGPMRSYFDRTATGPAALHRWVHDNGQFPDGGRDFVYRPREGFALTGRAVPHARLPQQESAFIGALFYSGLV
ncbi:hypothetical protein [Micromonospora echinaurantiaca]|uniref:hypothetical protein n=1 Tax=Micromonospora echinaurantiaca TaxID=47857 RepID=UPI003416C3B3